MDLHGRLREDKLEEIRKYLSKFFNVEHTKEEALGVVIEHFYSDFLSRNKS